MSFLGWYSGNCTRKIATFGSLLRAPLLLRRLPPPPLAGRIGFQQAQSLDGCSSGRNPDRSGMLLQKGNSSLVISRSITFDMWPKVLDGLGQGEVAAAARQCCCLPENCGAVRLARHLTTSCCRLSFSAAARRSGRMPFL